MWLLLICAPAAAPATASDADPAPQFSDQARTAKLAEAFPEIDGIFRNYATAKRIPGMVWGIVIDGEIRHVESMGVADLASNAPITAGTVFRIASMTKSFTALAILDLRDRGKLSLDDPVSRWIPEFNRMELPTRDTPPITIRQLLSHSAGFPEDNPWADQQLAASDEDLTRWLRRGIPFSTPPGTRYEYSNFAFGLLGRIVTRASGVRYDEYVRTRILDPLHMHSTTFEFSAVPSGRRAVGYRLRPDGTYLEEPPLPQGAFGAAGGLLTDADDLGKYVAFHLAAWPPRDAPDDGPVRRSSVREMSQLWTPANLTARRIDGRTRTDETGYGFGLRVAADCRFSHIVAHGGGLPGFGSYMAWLPDYGVGMFAMATLTYSGPAEAVNQAWDAFLRTGALRPRQVPASPILVRMRDRIYDLWNRWDDGGIGDISAMNLLIDVPAAQRREEIRKLKDEMGECTGAGNVTAENWLRGQFNISCANGTVGAFFTLSPTQPPAVQHLKFQKLENDSVRLGAPTGAPAGVACSD